MSTDFFFPKLASHPRQSCSSTIPLFLAVILPYCRVLYCRALSAWCYNSVSHNVAVSYQYSDTPSSLGPHYPYLLPAPCFHSFELPVNSIHTDILDTLSSTDKSACHLLSPALPSAHPSCSPLSLVHHVPLPSPSVH